MDEWQSQTLKTLPELQVSSYFHRRRGTRFWDAISVCWIAMFALIVSAQDAVPHPNPPDKVDELRENLSLLEKKGFSGVVLISQNDHMILDQAFGSIRGKRVRATDWFWIASISKSFTAAAVMKCREQGLVNLEDPISRYLRNVPVDKESVTVLELLTHTSGLPQTYVSETVEDRDRAVKVLMAEKLSSSPGDRFSYSNANYELLAAIVEVTTGKRFEEYVRGEILEPLHLVNTGFWFDVPAKKVFPTKDSLPSRLKRRGWELGAGGMYSSPADLLSWSEALRSNRVLSPESTALIFSDHIKITEGFAGFGWFHAKTSNGREFWFTRGNDSFGRMPLFTYIQRSPPR